MPSPSVLDVEMLLAPIPGENPAGESLRYAASYDAIQEARRSDDDLEQGDWVRETKSADWASVIKIATEALATKSKDLQLAVWLVEALVKRHGFSGLRDSLRLLRELQECFWDGLYPVIEDEELEFRAAPLAWLNEKLPVSIRQIPITQGMNAEKYTWLHWKESREVDNLGRRDQQAAAMLLQEGKISGEQFDKAVDTTPLPYYQVLFDDLNETWQELEQLVEMVDSKFGREAPALTSIKQAIADCRTLVTDIGKKKGGLAPAPQPELTEQEPEPARAVAEPVASVRVDAFTHPATVGSLVLQSRADALRQLAAVADYFRRTEPHSPVSYLVQRAVRWGEMPLDEWLKDVIHDESVLGSIRETLGLKPPDNDGDTSTV
jgi:type VI secretion system protein ImpA